MNESGTMPRGEAEAGAVTQLTVLTSAEALERAVRGAVLDNVLIQNVDLSGRDLCGCSFRNAQLMAVTFDGCDLSSVILDRAVLSQCSLVDARAIRASMTQCQLLECSLPRARFDD